MKHTTKEIEVIMPFYYIDRKQNIGQCKLTINHNLSIAMVTQICQEKAESITNSASILANSICQYFRIKPEKLMLLERWTDKESYDRQGDNAVTALIQFHKNGVIEVEVIEEEYVKIIFEV